MPLIGDPVAAHKDGRMFDDDDDEATDLLERIALFCLQRRTMPDHAHDVLWIGRYALVEKHSEGAMGVVCRAIDPHFPGRPVALKIPKSGLTPPLRQRIREEGALLARVRHTHVLTVYEVGECEGTLYIAAEFVEGPSLRAWQAGRSWRELLALYLQVGEGLAEIHRKGIVHQDIKPENVRIDADGRARVLDFGLAHLETSLLAAGAGGAGATFYRGGTRGYMAPEQHLQGPIDARADQFSFCACLWEALAGGLPYAGEGVMSTAPGRPRPPLGAPRSPLRSGPGWLRTILLRGLAERREDRFPTMDALLAAIRRRLHARWWPTLTSVGAAGLGGALAAQLLAASAVPAICRDPSQELAGVTGPGRLAALDAKMSEVPGLAEVWPQVRGQLERAGEAWVSASQAACTALAGGPAWSAASRCLLRARAELQALSGRLEVEPAAARELVHGGWSADLREAAGRCADPGIQAEIEPPRLAEPATVAAIEADLAAGAAALHLREGTAAERALLRARGEAQRTGDPSREGWALAGLGEVMLLRGQPEQARDRWREAARAAARSGDRALGVRVWARLVEAEVRVGHPEVALELFAVADAGAARDGLAGTRDASRLLLAGARAAQASGDLRRAGALLDRAEAVLVAPSAEDAEAEVLRARIEVLRGLVADHADERAGYPFFLAAERRLRAVLGPSHPERVSVLRMLGNSLALAGEPAEAAASLAAARALAEASLDAGDVEHVLVRVAQAQFAAEHDVWRAAGRLAEEAELLLQRTDRIGTHEASIKLAALRGAIAAQDEDEDAMAAAFGRGLALARGRDEIPVELRRRTGIMAIGLAERRLARGLKIEAGGLTAEALATTDACAAQGDPACFYIFGTAAKVALELGDPAEALILVARAGYHHDLADGEGRAEVAAIAHEARAAFCARRPELCMHRQGSSGHGALR